MSWAQTKQIAQAVGCTPEQLEALELEERGLSQRTIALALRISRSTVRSRLEGAHRKINETKEAA